MFTVGPIEYGPPKYQQRMKAPSQRGGRFRAVASFQDSGYKRASGVGLCGVWGWNICVGANAPSRRRGCITPTKRMRRELLFSPSSLLFSSIPWGGFPIKKTKHRIDWWLTLLAPQSHFGDKLLKIWLVCPQNGTAVLKGLRRELAGGQGGMTTSMYT